jgi:hypothetical protein
MTNHARQPSAVGLILHLIAFGLVAGMIAISFGFELYAILHFSRDTLEASRIGEAGIEFGYPRASIAPYTDRPVVRAAAQADPPSSAGLRIRVPATVQDPPTSLAQPDQPGSSEIFDPLPDWEPEPSPTTVQSPHASPRQLAPDKAPPVEADEPHAAAAVPIAQSVSVSPNASSTPSPAEPLPGKDRKRLFQDFQIQHVPRSRLDQATTTSRSTAPAEPVPSGHSDQHSPSARAAFRYRVRKECGPISDPELRRQCIRSFSTRHP